MLPNNLYNLRLIFIIVAFGLLSCQSQTNSPKPEKTTEVQVLDSIVTNLESENFEKNCQSEFNNKTFEYLYEKNVPEHLHTLKFHCNAGRISGIMYGPSPEGEHRLYFFKAELENIEIAGDSIIFEFVKGDFYGEQITQANFEQTSKLETYGGSSGKLEMRGKLTGNTLTLKCYSEFYECYDSEMKFYLKS